MLRLRRDRSSGLFGLRQIPSHPPYFLQGRRDRHIELTCLCPVAARAVSIFNFSCQFFVIDLSFCNLLKEGNPIMELVYNIPDLPIAYFIIRAGPHIETEIRDLASVNFITSLKPRGMGATTESPTIMGLAIVFVIFFSQLLYPISLG